MFGRKLLLGCVFVLVIGLSGCQKEVISDLPNDTEIIGTDSNYVNDYFELVEGGIKTTSDFVSVSSDDLLNVNLVHNWPEGIYFTPLYLSEAGVVYGEADASNNRSELYLASYDMNKGEFKEIKRIDSDSLYASIKVILVTDEFILFEEYDQAIGVAQYYYYDLKNDTYEDFHRIENIPPHTTDAVLTEDGIMLNMYDETLQHYVITFYSFDTKEFNIIEDKNSGYPVYYKNQWYYLRVDNETFITQLVAYETETKSKKVIYETEGQNMFMFGLYGDENNLLLVMENDSIEKVYKVDIENKKIGYFFEDEWIESIVIKNGLMSWTGTTTIENRIRPQIYLLDLDSEMQYLYTDNILLLANHGIAWVDLNKSDIEVGKGQIFINESSQLAYKNMN